MKKNANGGAAMKRICILMPAITDMLQGELIHSACESAFSHGLDVIILTNATNVFDDFVHNAFSDGEENIFTLLRESQPDGVVFPVQFFHKTALIEQLCNLIEECGIPCVTTGQRLRDFPYAEAPQRTAMSELTEHLITAHSCKRIICLTGPEGNPDAETRLAGVLDAAKQHGIEIPPQNILYGDFWKYSAAVLADRLAVGEIPMPDAVICGNDIMAETLCDRLAENGVSVPQDVIVTGFDGHIQALAHVPSVTTVGGQNRVLGRIAVQMLCAQIGIDANLPAQSMQMIPGASCGCVNAREDSVKTAEQVQIYIRRDYESTYSLEMQNNTGYIADMAEAEHLWSLIGVADGTTHILSDFSGIDLCILPDWEGDFRHPEQYRAEGYPDEMYLALSKRGAEHLQNGIIYPTSDLIPSMSIPHTPALFYVMPLHHVRRVYGYAVFSGQTNPIFRIHPVLVSWLNAFANGLRALQKQHYTEYLREKSERASMYDLMSGLYSKKGILYQLKIRAEQNRRYMLLLMTVRQLMTERSTDTQKALDLQIDAEMMITNALRLILHSDDSAAHLSENVFLLLTPIPASTDLSAFAEQAMIRLETLMKKTQDSIAAPYLPAMIYQAAEITDYSELFLMQQLEMLVQKASASPQKIDYTQQLTWLRREIFSSPQSDWNEDTAARMLCISRSYLQKMYKQQFSVTFIDDVINARLLKAKLLLTTTNLRIHEIAEQCGYNNPTHFMRQFRSKTGMTAAEYRISAGK